jgi:hypothetical protein
MATNKNKSLNRVFVSIGKVKEKQPDGTTILKEKFIVLSEELAKFAGAQYLSTPPLETKVEVKRGVLTGRTHTRPVSVRITGKAYKIGYVDGLTPKVEGRKRRAKIKWISLYVTKGVTLRTLLKTIRTKFSKKPVYFKTPDGVTTRFVFN